MDLDRFLRLNVFLFQSVYRSVSFFVMCMCVRVYVCVTVSEVNRFFFSRNGVYTFNYVVLMF